MIDAQSIAHQSHRSKAPVSEHGPNRPYDGYDSPMAQRREPRLREVADASGVDPSVVSRVISGDPSLRIRPETRERVLAAIAQVGYRPNAAARALKMARTNTIGMIVPTIASPVTTGILDGAAEAAGAAGYRLLIMNGPVRDFVNDLHGRVDGALITLATRDTTFPAELRNELPMLLVNRQEPWGIPSLIVDDERAAVIATNHLIGLGHKRIGHVAGLLRSDTARRRLAGFKAAMGDAGLEVHDSDIIESLASEARGMAAAEQILRQTPRPTALFVLSIRAAVGAMAAARNLNLKVPDDVSIISLHDTDWAPYLDPPLTTVRLPLFELGQQAVETLLRLDDQTPVTTMVASPPELVVRGSTAAPPAVVRDVGQAGIPVMPEAPVTADVGPA
jgi:LacI family transcriptional regulator